MATVRIYPTVCTSHYSRDAIYATAAAGAGASPGLSDGTWNSNDAQHGQQFSLSLFTLTIGYARFDTSFLANIGTVTGAVFKTVNAPDTSTTDFTSNIRLFDWGGDNPGTEDWVTPSGMASKTLLAHYDTSGGFSGTISYVDDAAVANINTSGITRVIFSSSRYESETIPLGNEFVQPTWQQTYLEITYTPAANNTPLNFPPPLDTDNGYIQSYSEVSYADARAGASLTANSAANSFPIIGQLLGDFKGTPTYTVYQYFIRFDTSILGGITPLTAQLQFYMGSDFSTTNFDIQARLHTWGTSLTTADWVAGASLSGKTLLAHLTTSGITANAYNNMTDDALLANLNTSGYTDIIFCSSRQTNNNAPTNDEFISTPHMTKGIWTRLVVTYTPPAPAAATGSTLVMLGVG